MKRPSSNKDKLARQLQKAVLLHRGGDRAGAIRIYRKILKADPDNADALNFLGMAAYQAGKPGEARQLMKRALSAAPDSAMIHQNMGNLMVESEDFQSAVQCYRRAAELDPADPSIHANLSVAYRRMGDYARAVDASCRAVQMGPGQMIAWYNLGNALRAQKKYRKAIDAYRKALQLNPGFTPARDSLCRTTLGLESLSLLGRRSFKKTRKAYEEWLAQEPDSAVASFMLKAVSGDELPRAPDSVVSGMFDRSADTFEEHLARLKYRVPQLMKSLLAHELGEPGSSLAVLDGGCGTGLCGPCLRPYANRLVGVDLSSGMLKKARAKGFYDELVESELTAYLEQCSERFDLIVFADTLCYFGELHAVFRAAAGALKSNGMLVFSVEKADDDETRVGYRLHPHGRYNHTRDYIESQLSELGFESIALREETLRLEVGVPVAGLLVTASWIRDHP